MASREWGSFPPRRKSCDSRRHRSLGPHDLPVASLTGVEANDIAHVDAVDRGSERIVGIGHVIPTPGGGVTEHSAVLIRV